MAEEEWPCIWDPDCPEVFDTRRGRNSHKQSHNPYLTCGVCGRDDIKLMGDHLKKWCKGPPPDYEPHIEVDLREWEGREHRLQELEGVERDRDRWRETALTKDKLRGKYLSEVNYLKKYILDNGLELPPKQ